MKVGALESLTSGNSAFKVYGDTGIIDLPKQSGCSVYLSANQTIANSTVTKVQCDTENYDVQNEYDNVTNYRWTCTKDGKYLISANMAWYNNQSAFRVQNEIYKNGATVYHGEKNTGTANYYDTNRLVKVLNLVAGDYIEIEAIQWSGGDVDLQSSAEYTQWQVTKLH